MAAFNGIQIANLFQRNLTKAILCLPLHSRSQFYKFTRDRNLVDGCINLLLFKKWLDDQIKKRKNNKNVVGTLNLI